MALRDSRSSTQRLGFRIDAVSTNPHPNTNPNRNRNPNPNPNPNPSQVSTPHGHKTAFDSELHSVREDAHVLETFCSFLPQAG